MFNHIRVYVKAEIGAIIPTYAHDGDACADLYANEEKWIEPGQNALVSTGMSFAFSENFVGEIRPRSGLTSKRIIAMFGTLDSSYRGVVLVNLLNLTSERYKVERSQRIAQLGFVPIHKAAFLIRKDLPESERGTNGHGSSGV